MNANEISNKYGVEVEENVITVNQEVEVGGLEHGRVVKATCYTMTFWQSGDGRVRRVYLDIQGSDVTHQLYRGDWNAQQGREWRKTGKLPFGFFEMTDGKLQYRKAKNGNFLNGKTFDQPQMREIAQDMLN